MPCSDGRFVELATLHQRRCHRQPANFGGKSRSANEGVYPCCQRTAYRVMARVRSTETGCTWDEYEVAYPEGLEGRRLRGVYRLATELGDLVFLQPLAKALGTDASITGGTKVALPKAVSTGALLETMEGLAALGYSDETPTSFLKASLSTGPSASSKSKGGDEASIALPLPFRQDGRLDMIGAIPNEQKGMSARVLTECPAQQVIYAVRRPLMMQDYFFVDDIADSERDEEDSSDEDDLSEVSDLPDVNSLLEEAAKGEQRAAAATMAAASITPSDGKPPRPGMDSRGSGGGTNLAELNLRAGYAPSTARASNRRLSLLYSARASEGPAFVLSSRLARQEGGDVTTATSKAKAAAARQAGISVSSTPSASASPSSSDSDSDAQGDPEDAKLARFWAMTCRRRDDAQRIARLSDAIQVCGG